MPAFSFVFSCNRRQPIKVSTIPNIVILFLTCKMQTALLSLQTFIKKLVLQGFIVGKSQHHFEWFVQLATFLFLKLPSSNNRKSKLEVKAGWYGEQASEKSFSSKERKFAVEDQKQLQRLNLLHFLVVETLSMWHVLPAVKSHIDCYQRPF